ncbi:MAG: ABC transporter permease, partial [Desulfobacterales bacterium]
NAAFVMNIIDYLNGREDIAVMRGKEQRLNPLDDTTASVKTFVKTFNIAGLPILIVLFGLSVWFRRHSRKKHIQMMFQK